jgi:dihydropteroate synthase
MFEPLTLSDLASASSEARIYCRPIGFVDRPHEWDGAAARLGDSLLWFSHWQFSLRDGRSLKQAVCATSEWDQWLAAMPSGLGEQAQAQRARALAVRPSLSVAGRQLRLHEPLLMGILNVTPDSFSDGGLHDDAAAAIDAGFAMIDQGAAIIDVGGESTRPGAATVWEGDEIKRVEPVIAALARGGAVVSVDTRKAAVMEAALAAGAAIINDVSALRYDDRAMEVAAASDAPIILMHAASEKGDAADGAGYLHPLFDVYDMLEQRIVACEAAGIARSRLILDPGIGFGKGVADNLALLNGLSLFHGLGCPILFAASRKRLIGALDGEAAADQRLGGTVALHYQAVAQGAQMIRVHDVAENRQALRMWRGLRDAALSA